MAVGDTLPNCTGTGTSSDPYIYTTLEGFLEAIAVGSAYVEAGENNLVLNAKGEENGINIVATSIKGKGTSILNIFNQGKNTPLINLNRPDGTSSSSGYSITVKDVNFYNLYNDGSSQQSERRFIYAYPPDYGTFKFENCNFSGLLKGNPIGNNSENALITWDNNYSGQQHGFKDCTFNFNIDVNNAGNLYLFSCRAAMLLDNCTICLSGKTKRNLYISAAGSYNTPNFKNTTITNNIKNKPINPLILDNSDGNLTLTLQNNRADNPNYMKLNVQKTSETNDITLAVSNATRTLVNKSLLPENTTISGSCIAMQSIDTTADDYIYNADNLANHGFTVGKVIV